MLNIDYTFRYGYYIKYEQGKFYGNSNANVAKFLKIKFKEYCKILKSFNARSKYGEYFFKNEIDALQCCDYLNEKYIVMLKLMEVE